MPLTFENTEKIPNSNTGYHTKDTYFPVQKLRKDSPILRVFDKHDIALRKKKSPTLKNQSPNYCLLPPTFAAQTGSRPFLF